MKLSQEEFLTPFIQKVTDQAHAVSTKATWALTLIAILFASINQTWMVAIAASLVLLLIVLISGWLGKSNGYINSVVFAGFTILFQYQLSGLPASHFFFFVIVTVLLFYENPKVLIPAVIIHVLFEVFLFSQAGKYETLQVFIAESGNNTLEDILLHVAIVALYATLSGVWAVLQHRQTKESAMQAFTLQEQVRLIEINQQFAEYISKGELKAEYPSAEPDALGKSLLTMRTNLIEAKSREEKEKFVTVGLAAIGEILRTHVNDLQQLCDKVLVELIHYMKANQGFIFTLEKENGEEQLHLASAYAWNRKKYLQRKFDIGQGLVGQAAIEKSTIYMTDIPENYVMISSGLGEANPTSILIIPLKNEEQVVGVLEMASFRKFEKFEIEFLEKVGESIASTILNSRNNERNKELLEQSHMLTEQMKAQEEEMRQNMEEMQATQEEMARTQRIMAEQSQEVEIKQNNLDALINATSDSIIAMDKHYKIIIMNDTLRKRYKGTQYEGLDVGADALQTLGAVRDEWKAYYDRALAGEHLQFVLKSTVKGEDSYREYFINPMLDKHDKVFGLSVVSRDVTTRHKAEDETSRRGFIINALINFTNDTYFAIDKNLKILIANNVLKERFKAGNIQLTEGMMITEVLSEEAQKVWMPRYEKALAGEKLYFTEERKVGNDKVLFLEVFVEPIKDDKENVIGCAVVSRDITEVSELRHKLKA
ncbi:MAG: PAS domain-containing protein [Cyclobacteriaceae bacterium]|nr:PAS domain-containing protein [Cyclobacteriaceae bacterium]